VNSFGEATYWHNHPDLSRLAQSMREQLEKQQMTASVSWFRAPHVRGQ
jgi:hypothetical protein